MHNESTCHIIRNNLYFIYAICFTFSYVRFYVFFFFLFDSTHTQQLQYLPSSSFCFSFAVASVVAYFRSVYSQLNNKLGGKKSLKFVYHFCCYCFIRFFSVLFLTVENDATLPWNLMIMRSLRLLHIAMTIKKERARESGGDEARNGNYKIGKDRQENLMPG